ncbi:hypothetical protein J2X01_001434 [Arthrobacter ginsengisoli]|uniref:DUF4386 domain-containing protein n=1 Tax=Arthrobacter ginsengisoli TaxID=1356565 RepID=A0ABU1UAD5_9MICC|nr:hypothetical protein [Arthrobacter ginsengisoli]MDR7082149.1 hypothetical protein [Arthrobacter ginsengisoli]
MTLEIKMSAVRGSRRLSGWAVIYVLAWLSGLAAGPSHLAGTLTASQLHAFYLESGGAALVQALLVHGAAGVALAGMALGLPRTATSQRLIVAATVAGLGAAILSLAQSALAAVAALGAERLTAEGTLGLVHAIDRFDSLKLLLLAIFVATVTALLRSRGFTPRWLTGSAALLSPMLVAGAAAFLVSNQVLDTVLAGSLVLLLVWASVIAWTMRPRRTPSAPEILQSRPTA